ncbi:unnamed protein product [Blepharisma stoltei]|uniref:UBC core domain-containing protein n=1 Tax=Blepharisma stoltei TaxID=1481888 RepID=A0AAU9ISK7_9CILI|nr:unnamed protein product [Blepharisma stoltei]CAG9324180.1 unnamed protein product [Blepharisma stoltei]
MDSATERLMRDLNEMRSDPLPYATADIDGNNFRLWKGTLNGPPGTPYEGGLFEFQLNFPADYPTNPPTCKFITPIFHPNVYSDSGNGNGNVCLPIFRGGVGGGWNSRFTPKTIISYIIALLNDPNAAGGYAHDPTTVLKRSKDEFIAKAREHTYRHAMG